MRHGRALGAPSPAWLLFPNIGASILAFVNLAWPFAPLLYCAGNGLWILLVRRRSASTETEIPKEREEPEGLGLVWVPCLLMSLGSLSLAWLSQPATTLNNGLAWDGQHYHAMYTYFTTGWYVPSWPQFPFYQRIGMPFLAAQLPLPAREAFLLLHGLFWCGTMVLFTICGRLCFGLRSASIHLGVLWLQMLWFSVPRATASDGFLVDSSALFFMQAWIFLLLWERGRRFLPLCAFVGVLFKETILLLVLLSIAALGAVWLIARFKRSFPIDLPVLRLRTFATLLLAAAAAVAAKAIASDILPHAPRLTGELDTIVGWLGLRVREPSSGLRYLAAAFAAYGGFALLWIATLGKPRDHAQRWTFTFAMALCPLYLAICFVAGSDLTKFALMAFPFALPILLARLDEVSPKFAVLALLLGIPAAHAFTPIASTLAGHSKPDHDLEGIYSWMMEYAHLAIVGSWMAWWLACILVLRSAGFTSAWRPHLSRIRAVPAPTHDGREWKPVLRAPRSRARRRQDRDLRTVLHVTGDRRLHEERRIRAANLG